MTHEFTAVTTTYWIAHSRDLISSGVLEPGEHVSSGLNYFETYDSPLMQQTRLASLEQDYSRAVLEWLDIKRLRDPLAHLADYRWRKETGGIVLTSGVHMQTDRISQSQLSSTLIAMAEGMVAEPVKWKAISGWVDMSLADIRAAATEVAEHVAKCFAAEEAVVPQVAADPTIDVEAAFDAAYAGA